MNFIKNIAALTALGLLSQNCIAQDSADSSTIYSQSLRIVSKHLDSLKGFFNDKDLNNYILNIETHSNISQKLPNRIGDYKINIVDKKKRAAKHISRKPILIILITPLEFQDDFFRVRLGLYSLVKLKKKYLYGNRGSINSIFEYDCKNHTLQFLRAELRDQ
jgi:hypothetical protein